MGSGAALALFTLPACGGNAASNEPAGASGASGAGSAGGQPAIVSAGANSAGANSAGANSAGAASIGQQLAPYPVEALGCSGPVHDGGYYGQCCAKARCYTPEVGTECVAPDAAPEKLGTSFGSGSCLCGATPVQGPYANNPAHDPEEAGTCCYVVSSISCDGRPLLVDGTPLVSAATRRCDWVSSDLQELLA
jgi:hypothetical protein